MIIMSADLGQIRTGLAICDKNETIAYPLCVIEEINTKNLAVKVAEHVKNNDVQMLVLGLPKNMDGSEGESARRTYKFETIIKKHINIPVIFWDERQTTIIAEKYLSETNTYGKKRKKVIDSVAASIILEDYLKFRKCNKT